MSRASFLQMKDLFCLIALSLGLDNSYKLHVLMSSPLEFLKTFIKAFIYEA